MPVNRIKKNNNSLFRKKRKLESVKLASDDKLNQNITEEINNVREGKWKI